MTQNKYICMLTKKETHWEIDFLWTLYWLNYTSTSVICRLSGNNDFKYFYYTYMDCANWLQIYFLFLLNTKLQRVMVFFFLSQILTYFHPVNYDLLFPGEKLVQRQLIRVYLRYLSLSWFFFFFLLVLSLFACFM